MTSVDRTAYPRFGRVVSGRELADSFTPTDAEAGWARGRVRLVDADAMPQAQPAPETGLIYRVALGERIGHFSPSPSPAIDYLSQRIVYSL